MVFVSQKEATDAATPLGNLYSPSGYGLHFAQKDKGFEGAEYWYRIDFVVNLFPTGLQNTARTFEYGNAGGYSMKLLNIGVNHPWDVSISEFAKRYDVVELLPSILENISSQSNRKSTTLFP